PSRNHRCSFNVSGAAFCGRESTRGDPLFCPSDMIAPAKCQCRSHTRATARRRQNRGGEEVPRNREESIVWEEICLRFEEILKFSLRQNLRSSGSSARMHSLLSGANGSVYPLASVMSQQRPKSIRPSWISDELMAKTRATWEPDYGHPLSDDET